MAGTSTKAQGLPLDFSQELTDVYQTPERSKTDDSIGVPRKRTPVRSSCESRRLGPGEKRVHPLGFTDGTPPDGAAALDCAAAFFPAHLTRAAFLCSGSEYDLRPSRSFVPVFLVSWWRCPRPWCQVRASPTSPICLQSKLVEESLGRWLLVFR
jgi:hypothetical protein